METLSKLHMVIYLERDVLIVKYEKHKKKCKKGYNEGYNECKRELEDKYSHPVERIIIDTLYLTRDSIIYKTKYIKQIEHDTIEKVYNLDTDGTLDLFYKLVSE